MLNLNGAFNLSKIPKHLIRTNSKGEKIIYVDVRENLRGADQYGNTHTITVYDKDAGHSVYLANLKEREQMAAKPKDREDDMPF